MSFGQSFGEQLTNLAYLQGTATVPATINGNGMSGITAGFLGAQQVEIIESGGGTATVTLQGSMDGTRWYTVGYQQVDAVAAPSRSVSPISVLANSAHVYQLLDPYEQVRAVVSAISGASVIARVYLVPA